MSKETFYMLYAENQAMPTFKHTTYDSALTEAKRLSETLQLKIFILEARQSIKSTKFEIITLQKEDELPF